MNIKKYLVRGFTIIELLVVITIIAILASVTFVVYSGIQTKAREISVLSDLDHMDALQTNYGLKNKTAGILYDSVNGTGSELGFTPSSGNVITVTIDSKDYCITGYNPNSTKNSIDNADIKESSPGACTRIKSEHITTAPTPDPLLVTVSPLDYSTTNYSWSVATCPFGATARYQYRYTVSPTGYDSGLVVTTNTSANFTTSTFAQTYTLQVQAQCYSADYPTGGPWNGIGSTSYTRPNPTIQVLVVAGGGGGGSENNGGNDLGGGGGGAGGVV